MHLLHQLSELERFKQPIFLTLGVFDGVHLGHQAIIRQIARLARTTDGEAAIITFHPHPAKILRPESAPLLLTTEQQDYELFSGLDVDICIILNFDQDLSLCPPKDFLDQLLKSAPTLHTVVVGPNWHFGHGREGDFRFLKAWANHHKVQATEVTPVYVGKEVVSSTTIRNQIARGDVIRSNAGLGRPYQIVGRVIHGKGVGTQLGFPTANLDVENELIPAHGVYAVRALLDGEVFAAVVNIGSKPTVSKSGSTTIEAHLLEFRGDIYGHHLRLDFLAFIRQERKFETIAHLKTQIHADIKASFQLAHL